MLRTDAPTGGYTPCRRSAAAPHFSAGALPAEKALKHVRFLQDFQIQRGEFERSVDPAYGVSFPSRYPPGRTDTMVQTAFAPRPRSAVCAGQKLRKIVPGLTTRYSGFCRFLQPRSSKGHPLLICTPNTGHPVLGVFLCDTVMSTRSYVLKCTDKENGQKRQ